MFRFIPTAKKTLFGVQFGSSEILCWETDAEALSKLWLIDERRRRAIPANTGPMDERRLRAALERLPSEYWSRGDTSNGSYSTLYIRDDVESVIFLSPDGWSMRLPFFDTKEAGLSLQYDRKRHLFTISSNHHGHRIAIESLSDPYRLLDFDPNRKPHFRLWFQSFVFERLFEVHIPTHAENDWFRWTILPSPRIDPTPFDERLRSAGSPLRHTPSFLPDPGSGGAAFAPVRVYGRPAAALRCAT